MHLLVIFKCHLGPEVNHLIIIVPNELRREKNKVEKTFDSLQNVISSFFEKENYINVESCYIIAY